MPANLFTEAPEVFANAWLKLPPSLAAQAEEKRLDEEDEASSDERFTDPTKTARFLRRGGQALAGPRNSDNSLG